MTFLSKNQQESDLLPPTPDSDALAFHIQLSNYLYGLWSSLTLTVIKEFSAEFSSLAEKGKEEKEGKLYD